MTVLFCVLPMIGSGAKGDYNRPKYSGRDTLGPGLNLHGSVTDFGEGGCLWVLDETPEEQSARTALIGQPDVLAFPPNLDGPVSSTALPIVQDALERFNMPVAWITTGHTYRQVLGAIIRVSMLLQRHHGLRVSAHRAPRLFEPGVTLNSRWNEFTQETQEQLLAMADSFKIDSTGVTGTMSLWEILLTLGARLPTVRVGGVDF